MHEKPPALIITLKSENTLYTVYKVIRTYFSVPIAELVASICILIPRWFILAQYDIKILNQCCILTESVSNFFEIIYNIPGAYSNRRLFKPDVLYALFIYSRQLPAEDKASLALTVVLLSHLCGEGKRDR